MSVADNVRKIGQEAEPAIERWLDAAEVLTGLRDVAKESGLNWSALKALLVAKVRDNKDGGDRVQKMAERLDVALEYAFMLSDRGGTKNVPPQSDPAPNPHKASPASVSVAAGNVIPLDATSQATTRRPIPPARHDPLITPSAPGIAPESQSVASDSSLTSPSGDGEAATTSALAVASSFLCTACGAEREEAESLCWSCRAADLPQYRVSDSELLATPSVAHDRPLNRTDDGDAATKGSAVAASTNPTVGASPTNDDDQFNRIPDVLDRNRVTA